MGEIFYLKMKQLMNKHLGQLKGKIRKNRATTIFLVSEGATSHSSTLW